MPAHQNIQSLGAAGLYGTNTTYGAGGTPVPMARDALDAMRIGQGRVPSAEYPDGYLGTLHTRREDRLLDSLKSRVTQRSYQRGVHKGSRIDPQDYFYPEGLDPQRGLRAESRGMRTAPRVDLAPAPHLVNDGKSDIPNNIPIELDARRREQYARMTPVWK